ncbi:MAG TPA: SDR family oxidoreductase [Candidatus Dormibacteraeota bacterium]|jgi:NAD(P)-dependent dehydrogenase (short-subunit alcohol dehydrogenase family)
MGEENDPMGISIVTGASRGLGRALAAGLASRGWSLVIDARGAEALSGAEAELQPLMRPGARLVAIAGDVTDPKHRQSLAGAAHALGGLDLLVNNAGILGPSPLPKLHVYPLDGLRDVIEVYVVAALGLIQETIAMLRAAPSGGRILMVTSDASVEAYEGWGGYGAAKAAVDQLARVLAVEEPTLHVWAVDPGDLRTFMHQQAFPGEDISDRPEPDAVVPAIIGLIESNRQSGRVRAAELVANSVAP